MKIWHRNAITSGACCAVLLGVCAAATAAAAAQVRTAAAATACSAANTQIWLGVGEGGGFAGGYLLPLELSNVGRRTCALYGYPGVSAYSGRRQVGPAAMRMRERHAVVTLAPGATAYAPLRFTDATAVCGLSPVSADGLKVYAPGQRVAKLISTPVTVCPHRAVLGVGAIRAGTGIPGYITE
jgi:hypothetical protein